ncbi:metallophosphoesterase family protein [Sphingomonas morindae]|uniref:Serine/threonine protein phosphatase n=1 Tax=Sphingomonas morindae TaxID=1541170 RepID=A0ABY4XDE3_9SPHN|nr:metallophosphoesterase family protein [Sphingomonas morindae]USI74869.1 serine/threonine protein phosphatase [Sphingomonas morindae]
MTEEDALPPAPPAPPAARDTPPVGQVEGQLVYAIGDIHGCYAPLRALLGSIAEDVAARAAGRTPILLFCGDYVDRGPASSQVLDCLVWLRRHSGYRVHCLKGNHEQVMLDYLADPAAAADWLRFGGGETLASYGVSPPAPDAPPADHVAARDDLLEALPVAHLRLLEGLELLVGIGDFAFVHAGIRPGVALRNQAEEDLLWIRETFLSSAEDHGKIIVHGHSWRSDAPQLHDNRIGIDTGTYDTGVLTALRLEDGAAAILQARG